MSSSIIDSTVNLYLNVDSIEIGSKFNRFHERNHRLRILLIFSLWLARNPQDTLLAIYQIFITGKQFADNVIDHSAFESSITRPVQSMFVNELNRADSRFAPSHWQTALLCNDVSYWLGASLESALAESFWITYGMFVILANAPSRKQWWNQVHSLHFKLTLKQHFFYRIRIHKSLSSAQTLLEYNKNIKEIFHTRVLNIFYLSEIYANQTRGLTSDRQSNRVA